MAETAHTDVTIIGAGLTGLSLAHFLKKAGKNVRIIESQDRCGGVIRSIHQDGFTFETGPNTGVASNDAADELFKDLEGKCTVEEPRPESKARWIWKAGKWHALPSEPISGLRTSLFSTYDKFRVLGEPFRKPGTDPNETVADMVKRRLGQSYLDYAVDPFVSGVYAGDPNYLVTQYALPKLYKLEQNYGSFLKGGLKRGKELKTERAQRKYNGIFSFEGGMEKLIHALEKELGSDELFLSSQQLRVSQTSEGFTINAMSQGILVDWSSSQVVSASGSTQFKDILPFVAASDFDAINQLKHARIIQVAVGFKQWNGLPLNAYGGLIPSKEKRNALGILFPSSIFNKRAPEKGALLSIFMGGFRNPEMIELSDAVLEKMVVKEIQETLQLEHPSPDMISIHKYHKAIPQYGSDSGERIAAIQKIESQHPGLFLAGNLRDGIGMADRIQQAWTIAKQITTPAV